MAASDDRSNERTGGGGGDEEEAVKTDGWLNTYADMVTLLLTFFVLLVAMSATDNERVELFLAALSRGGITAEQFMEIRDKYSIDEFNTDPWDDSFPAPRPDDFDVIDLGGTAALHALYETMEVYIDAENLGEDISLVYNGDFLLLTLSSDILFETGHTEPTPEMIETAEMIAEMLAATFEPDDPFEIVVAGHTDNVPINTREYPSNWHISRDRAVNFLWVLLSESRLDPGLFYARAVGEYRPIASNDTEEGRQKNRRVEVMISLARDNPLWDNQQQFELQQSN